ncbi:hypothetical protein BDV96DRAFT_651370 [Lophiotrema nucula]|uniref:Uncharacterized protein n=1 Tax=Lophiotrema nucula TaxID=690887 RepID=A0A6A5YVV3_9PLEO|nr:hypothetical protein BDV96DRAFT_651370 [Lophiotrema nucula]
MFPLARLVPRLRAKVPKVTSAPKLPQYPPPIAPGFATSMMDPPLLFGNPLLNDEKPSNPLKFEAPELQAKPSTEAKQTQQSIVDPEVVMDNPLLQDIPTVLPKSDCSPNPKEAEKKDKKSLNTTRTSTAIAPRAAPKGFVACHATPGTTYYSTYVNANDTSSNPLSIWKALLYGIPDPDKYSYVQAAFGRTQSFTAEFAMKMTPKKPVDTTAPPLNDLKELKVMEVKAKEKLTDEAILAQDVANEVAAVKETKLPIASTVETATDVVIPQLREEGKEKQPMMTVK